MKARHIVLIMMTVVTGCATQRIRPQAQLFYHWGDVLKESQAWVGKLNQIEGEFNTEYQAALDNESAFVPTLTDQELQSYEAYSKINDTDSEATVEMRKRDLVKTLPPDKLTTAMEICDLKMAMVYGMNKIQYDKSQLLKRSRIIDRRLDDRMGQYIHRLTASDLEEIARLREAMDNYGTFVRDTVLAYGEPKE